MGYDKYDDNNTCVLSLEREQMRTTHERLDLRYVERKKKNNMFNHFTMCVFFFLSKVGIIGEGKANGVNQFSSAPRATPIVLRQ